MNVISTLVVFILEVSSLVVACAIRKTQLIIELVKYIAPLISSSVEVDNVPHDYTVENYIEKWFVSTSLSLCKNTNLLMG